MNELEKLREENKALKLLLEMKDAYIEAMEKTHQAEKFMIANKSKSSGGFSQGEKLKTAGDFMPAERKTLVITINENSTMSKTEDWI